MRNLNAGQLNASREQARQLGVVRSMAWTEFGALTSQINHKEGTFGRRSGVKFYSTSGGALDTGLNAARNIEKQGDDLENAPTLCQRGANYLMHKPKQGYATKRK